MTDSSLPILEDITLDKIPRDIFKKVPLEYFWTFRLLPVSLENNRLKLAVAKPHPFYPIDNLTQALNVSIDLVLMDLKKIEHLLRKLMESNLQNVEGLLQGQNFSENSSTIFSGEDLIRQGSDAPIVKMVNSILREATQEKVTDVHFHPKTDYLAVLYRRDGFLHEAHKLPREIQEGMVARLKVMAKLDVTQKQQPQDGRFSMKSADKEIEIRLSVVPTVQGERLVLRFLDRDNLLIRAPELGMSSKDNQILQPLMNRPNGMILVTGPTGSGKTTTLYSFISELDLSRKNVMTIEDPVEYKLEGITQMQVKPALGLTFAQGLRSLLRQDPDVILVGEIRDQETAQIAVRAALTGHLVLATLHTTDAPGAVTRLLDIGIEPYLIASALMAVISQRLVRCICQNCGMKGCSTCFSTGFRGRTGIFELLVLDEDFRKLIYEKKDLQAFRQTMTDKGIVGLEAAGLEKAVQNVTTREEVLRVVG